AVSNNDGGDWSAVSPAQFRYVATPLLTSVVPAYGLSSVMTAVGFTGTNFYDDPDSRCLLGSLEVAAAFVNSSYVTCDLPPLPAGVYTVEYSANGLDYTSSGLVTFELFDGPVVAGVEPAFGPLSGGTVVTVSGWHFFNGAGSETGRIYCLFG